MLKKPFELLKFEDFNNFIEIKRATHVLNRNTKVSIMGGNGKIHGLPIVYGDGIKTFEIALVFKDRLAKNSNVYYYKNIDDVNNLLNALDSVRPFNFREIKKVYNKFFLD